MCKEEEEEEEEEEEGKKKICCKDANQPTNQPIQTGLDTKFNSRLGANQILVEFILQNWASFVLSKNVFVRLLYSPYGNEIP